MITILPAFGDNYIYLLQYGNGQCLVVDPGQAGVVFKALKRHKLDLTHVLITHHHADHIGGVAKLKSQTDATVIAPDDRRIGQADMSVSDRQTISIADLKIHVIATPGHTASSICYYITGDSLEHPIAFTGDTMFVCGCGRMFECDGRTMYQSLCKLSALPDETHIYPGHDYTQENIEFALTFEPDHPGLKRKLAEVQALAQKGAPTVPSTIAEEKMLSCFLRPGTKAIRDRLGMPNVPDWEVFTALRGRKDMF